MSHVFSPKTLPPSGHPSIQGGWKINSGGGEKCACCSRQILPKLECALETLLFLQSNPGELINFPVSGRSFHAEVRNSIVFATHSRQKVGKCSAEKSFPPIISDEIHSRMFLDPTGIPKWKGVSEGVSMKSAVIPHPHRFTFAPSSHLCRRLFVPRQAHFAQFVTSLFASTFYAECAKVSFYASGFLRCENVYKGGDCLSE